MINTRQTTRNFCAMAKSWIRVKPKVKTLQTADWLTQLVG